MGNTANNNYDYGIYLNNCDDNNIAENTASNLDTLNQDSGIYLYDSDNNNINTTRIWTGYII